MGLTRFANANPVSLVMVRVGHGTARAIGTVRRFSGVASGVRNLGLPNTAFAASSAIPAMSGSHSLNTNYLQNRLMNAGPALPDVAIVLVAPPPIPMTMSRLLTTLATVTTAVAATLAMFASVPRLMP